MIMEKRPINVLLVEDSPVVRLLLTHALNNDPDLHVMGTAADGGAAVAFVSQEKPDIVLMDVHMPNMDGFEATRRIMETQPLPIIMCSATLEREEVTTTFRALEAGALAFVEKPVGPGHQGFDRMMMELVQSIKLMSEVKVVKRRMRSQRAEPLPATPKQAPSVKLIAIGASTGGPPVIQTVLSELPTSLPVPVLIVQHIAAGFLEGMVEWLRQTTGLQIQMAVHGQQALAGHVYLAPDGFQMGIGPFGRILLSDEPMENGLRPSVAYLFRSVASNFGGSSIGVLLTGMGRDGAEELKQMKDKGAVTIAQDAETSVVHGMPGEAIRLGGATHILSPPQIAAFLGAMVSPPC